MAGFYEPKRFGVVSMRLAKGNDPKAQVGQHFPDEGIYKCPVLEAKPEFYP